MTTHRASATALQSVGTSILRYALATNIAWIGALKFEDYEVENIRPLVTSSPLFSRLVDTQGEKKTARLMGITEIAIGALIAAKPVAPRLGDRQSGCHRHVRDHPQLHGDGTGGIPGGPRKAQVVDGGPVPAERQRAPRGIRPDCRRVTAAPPPPIDVAQCFPGCQGVAGQDRRRADNAASRCSDPRPGTT